jgi:integrase
MARYEFSSVFADEINAYIADRVAAGYDENSYRVYMIAFDRFCNAHAMTEPVFTIGDASAWIEQRDTESHTTHYSRVNASKHFLAYLSIKGYNVYVVRDVKYKGTDFQPHIYTDDETTRYFRAVDSYASTVNRKDALQYPVIFRILYCCGTRINETLGIKKEDVDLGKGIIRLNESKNNKQRYVVCGEDLRLLLNLYANRCFYLLANDDYIFTNANGGRIDEKSVYENHRAFLRQAGIPYVGGGEGPRIHDWRHHMAVYSFKQLTDSGLDMYVALPILSTYLGHKTIFATEKYVRLTLQLFPYIEEKFHGMAERIFGGDAYEEH